MPVVICECGNTQHWNNQQGTRLADLRCQCGKSLQRAVWTTEGWKPYPLRTKVGIIATCALCGRYRKIPGGGRRLQHDETFTVYRKGSDPWDESRFRSLTVPAGTIVCRDHSPRLATQIPY